MEILLIARVDIIYLTWIYPANIYVVKVYKEALEKGTKYVQTKQ